jgi:SAM-dependent methyltransferase
MPSFAVWFRRHLTDRANAPLRRRLAALIADGERVLEVGCANGRLLLELAPRISRGLGIDLDPALIAEARREAVAGSHPLEFVVADAADLGRLRDFAPSTLVAALTLHEMPPATARDLLAAAAAGGSRLLIADLIEPEARLARVLVHLDERLAGHHDRYLDYLAGGGVPGLLRAAGLDGWREHPGGRTFGLWSWQPGAK